MTRAKAEPGKLSYGHAGPASVAHLSGAAMEKAQGLRFNAIPYRGDGANLPQLMGGQIDFRGAGPVFDWGQEPGCLAVLAEKRHPSYLPGDAFKQRLGRTYRIHADLVPANLEKK